MIDLFKLHHRAIDLEHHGLNGLARFTEIRALIYAGDAEAALRVSQAGEALNRENHFYFGDAVADFLQAGLSLVEGDKPRALLHLHAAERARTRQGIGLFQQAATFHRTRLQAPSPPENCTATAYFRGQGVKNIERFAAMLLPVFPGDSTLAAVEPDASGFFSP